MQTDVVVEPDDVIGNVTTRLGVVGVVVLPDPPLFRLRKKRSMTALSQQLPLRLMLPVRP